MKHILFIVALVCITVAGSAQPCKLVKAGMNADQVTELVGAPDDVSILGTDNNVEISVWHYGNQRISFIGQTVDNVIADGKSYDSLVQIFVRKEITNEEFNTRLEELNRVACK